VNGGCQLASHGNVSAAGSRGAFLDANVPLHDTKEVGPVVANLCALDLEGVVVFLEGVVDEFHRIEAPKGI